jgi:hypothetical protein
MCITYKNKNELLPLIMKGTRKFDWKMNFIRSGLDQVCLISSIILLKACSLSASLQISLANESATRVYKLLRQPPNDLK